MGDIGTNYESDLEPDGVIFASSQTDTTSEGDMMTTLPYDNLREPTESGYEMRDRTTASNDTQHEHESHDRPPV